MKKLILFLILCFSIQFACAEEITLFNSEGNATAYIDTDDDDMTVYMWDGLPVAYLVPGDEDDFSIYGFNGKHLGWFDKGIVRDHDGYAVGFIKDAINKYTNYEPYKKYKKYKPYKDYKEYAPYKPCYQYEFSNEPLSIFLLRGKKE
jgi:hypothetical protein